MALEYSLDDGDTWTTFIGASDTASVNVVLANVGDKVCFRSGASATNGASGWQGNVGSWTSAKSAQSYKCFQSTKTFNLSGNIGSLIRQDIQYWNTNPGSLQFYKLFYGSKVVDASGLKMKFDSVGSQALQEMFKRCHQMEYGPELLWRTWPTAQTAASMFWGCDKLKSFKFDMIGWIWETTAFNGKNATGQGQSYTPIWDQMYGYWEDATYHSLPSFPTSGTMYYNGTYRTNGY